MADDKLKFYSRLCEQATGLFDGEADFLANSANLTALLFMEMTDINWVGFYFLKGHDLVLGPFQGNPACTRLPMGKGVCGTAATQRDSLIVDNVHDFDGHIACDGASNSEIVLPFFQQETLVGVLDIDSPFFNRFDQADADGLKQLLQILGRSATGLSLSVGLTANALTE